MIIKQPLKLPISTVYHQTSREHYRNRTKRNPITTAVIVLTLYNERGIKRLTLIHLNDN